MGHVTSRRQMWLLLAVSLVAVLIGLMGSSGSATAQSYPPGPTTTTTTHPGNGGGNGNGNGGGNGGGKGHKGTTTTNPHRQGGNAGANSQSGSTTTAAATVLGEQGVNPAVLGDQQAKSSSGLAFTGAQIAGLVTLALILLAVGTLFVLRARRPRASPH